MNSRLILYLILLLWFPIGAAAEDSLQQRSSGYIQPSYIEAYAGDPPPSDEIRQLRQQLDSANERMMLIRIIFVASILLVIIFFRYLRLKEKRRLEAEKAENERILAIAEDLRARLDDASASAMKTSMLEKMGFSVLERLCEQYYIYEGTENLQPKLLKEAKAVIEGLREDSLQLEKTLDAQKGGIISRFREEFPKFKDDEVRLFCFLAAGFNSTTISTLMEKDKQNIYNKIWRLKTRIAESDAPSKEVFLTFFSK